VLFARAVVRGDNEGSRPPDRTGKTCKVAEPQRAMPARRDDPVNGSLAEAGNAQQLLARRGVRVDGKARAIAQRPGELRVDSKREIRLFARWSIRPRRSRRSALTNHPDTAGVRAQAEVL